jgi:serine/threonine-protein kinase
VILAESSARPPADPLIGQRIDGRYTLEGLIGEGATGRVYRARQEATGREVAVKLLRDSLLHDEASVRRFQREARAACRVNHRNAIIVHDCGRTADGHFYLVTELIAGETLRDALRRDGVPDPDRAMWLFQEILSGVAAAHERGVVHRDLHPGNIFLCKDDHGEERVKVFDFGGARILDASQDSDVTGVGRLDLKQLVHSIRFLSPEQLSRDRRPDPRADVYALGLILFELCTGQYPFDSDDPLQVMAMHLREPPPLLSAFAPERQFSPALQGLVTAMLAKDPALRPGDAGEVLRRLQQAQERETLITLRDPVPEPEVEMEIVALPADEGEGTEDMETLPIPKAPAPEPLPAGQPAGRSLLREDTMVELHPLGVAAVLAVRPEPPTPDPQAHRPPQARRGDGEAQRVLAALLWLVLGAAGVFAAGAMTYHLMHRPAPAPVHMTGK